MSEKRFEIWKFYEGPPVNTAWGTTVTEADRVLHTTVEEYNHAATALARVMILNEGLAEKKYFLSEQIDEDVWVDVEYED